MSTKGPTSPGPSALDRRGPFTALSVAGRGGPVDHDGPFTGTVPAPWSPIDDPNVVEVYNAWGTSRHTYVAPREITQIVCDSILGKATVSCAGHGFLNGDVVFLAGGLGAFPNLAGAWTIIATPSADIFEIAQGEYDGTEEYEAPLPTVDWLYRKVSAVLGMRGLYSFTQSTLANMPQWDATAKEMLFLRDRSYYLPVPTGLRNSFATGGVNRAVAAVGQRTPDNSSSGYFPFYGNADGTGGELSIFGWAATNIMRFSYNNGSSGFFQWNNSANANGNTKLVIGNSGPAIRQLFVNDMITAKSSGTGDASGGNETRPLAIGKNRTFYFGGNIQVIVWATGGHFDQTYRENFKAWAEAQGATFG